jgi:predicted aspartyl protease
MRKPHKAVVIIILALLTTIQTGANAATDPEFDLISAILKNQLGRAEILIKQRIDLNRQDQHGWTALMHATSKGHEGVVKALLEAGADPAIVNEDGRAALDLANMRGKREIASLLLAAGQATLTHAVALPLLISRSKHLYVQGRIGSLTGLFVLDTGAQSTALTQQTADQLGLQADTLTTLPAIQCGDVTLAAGMGAIMPGLEEHAFKADSLRPLGLIGLNRLSRLPFTLDLPGKRIVFGPDPDFQQPGTVRLPFKGGNLNEPLIPVSINGSTVNLLIDTGASGLLVLHNRAVTAGLLKHGAFTATNKWNAANTMRLPGATVTVGTEAFSGITVDVAEPDTEPNCPGWEGIVGMNLLERFALRFEPNATDLLLRTAPVSVE